MSYAAKTISEVVSDYLNKDTYLPAIQREFVWGTYAIEKLFDSIMGDYPISSFLFWKIREERKKEWTAYEFIKDFDTDSSHNKEANLDGINKDIYLVLDGQQRLTSLYIGLRGSYKFFYYRWHKTKLYLNIFKEAVENDNPEELMYQFQFRENDVDNPKDDSPQYWYLVGDILNYDDAEDAKKSIKDKLAGYDENLRDNANTLIGRLHSRIHTAKLLNYYEEKSQNYDKVVEVFIRANTGGIKLEYSDILLSTATAKWNTLNAREEIHSFTDDINAIGHGHSFGKDFVLKGCLYLTDGLPIQYKVKNFTRPNLHKIESNWEVIKANIDAAIRLVSKFGFNDKNITSKMALLPVAYYLKKLDRKNFHKSTLQDDVSNQIIIQKWLTLALLKNAFGSSSDNTLKGLQEVINSQLDFTSFPFEAMNKSLNIESSFTDNEIENLLGTNYATKYSYLILSLLYPDRDWKDNKYHEDHIFPKSEFSIAKLRQRGYKDDRIEQYQQQYNSIGNLQLLSDSENLDKSANAFDIWFASRDTNFKHRHKIPTITNYGFDNFLEFVEERRKVLTGKLHQIKLDEKHTFEPAMTLS
jgi:hypothetical protein